MISYAKEKMADIIEEIKPLHLEQWQETEGYRHGLEFKPDYGRYLQYSESDFYVILTVRRDGELVGHISLYITTSMHTGTKLAQEDTLFLTKSARGGRTAMRLFQFAEAWMTENGVKELYCSVKNGASSKRLLESMGCLHVSDGYHKMLQG